jgi:HK97 gp10 family phage protein
MAQKTGATLTVLYNRFPQVAAELKAGRARIVKETAETVRDDAKQRAPVRTGQLRDSIAVEGEGDAARVTVGAPHGVYVEYGTSRSPAQPFLWPAVEAARAGYRQAWTDFLNGQGGGLRRGSMTVTPGRGTVRRWTGGRLPR